MRRCTVAFAAAAMTAVAGCTSSSTSSQIQPQTPTTAGTPARAYRIGESFELPGSNNVSTFRLAVDGVSNTVAPAAVQAYAKAYGSMEPPLDTQPDPGLKWVIVAVHGTNVGNEPGFFLTQFFVLTAGGKQFDVPISDNKAYSVANGYKYTKNKILSTKLNPEQTGYEWVVYQVPTDLPVQSIRINANGPSNEPSATVDLAGR